MPLTIKRTNITSIAANSVLFNGSSQYLSLSNSAAFNFGTGDLTIEFWIYFTAVGAGRAVTSWSLVSGVSGTWSVGIGNTSLNFSEVIVGEPGPSATFSSILNTWAHIAVSRSSGTTKLFLNGSQIASATQTTNFNNTSYPVYVSMSPSIPAYISNLRILKGTALYTSNFTPPTSTLTAIANTSLLTCNAATIVDSSTNNFTITNNGSATVSSINPFRAPINNFQFVRRASTLSGKSVQFDGTNDYLSVARILDNSTDVTIEAWVRATSTPTTAARYIVAQYLIGSSHRTIFYISTTLTVGMQIGSTSVESVAAITLNTWYHVAWVRSGSGANNFSIYINGVRDGQMTYTGTFQNVPTTIGGSNNYDAYGNSYFPGYISNLRILKGTALYTGASFIPPTSPLTAIANTALLTCNADTIIDGSTNNFTITNNNTATVSSVSPFVASSSGMSLKKVYADPIVLFGTQKAIFGYGYTTTYVSMTNLVSNTGVVATDTAGVGAERGELAAAGYGSDKAIFGYGYSSPNSYYSITNLVSNTGVVASNTTGVGRTRRGPAAAGYGSDKAIFGYGSTGSSTYVSMTNKVSNMGVVATDTTGVGTSRYGLAAASYGSDKAIFGYGYTSVVLSMTNLVSNTGVVSTDTTGVGTARRGLAAAGYGSDKAIFGYGNNGSNLSMTNLVSNTGIVATDTTGVGTARFFLAAAGYGGDKAIFGYGLTSPVVSMTNLVSNTGVVATDTTGVGTARQNLAAAGYSLT